MNAPAALRGGGLPPRLARLAAEIDASALRPEGFSQDLVRRVAATGSLGGLIPAQYGGLDLGYTGFGDLVRAVAEVSAAFQSLFTVHAMACRALVRWGSTQLRRRFLPLLAAGCLTASFALSEEEAGSDVQRIRTHIQKAPHGWTLNGRKTWISFGQTADVFLVFAICDEGGAAVLVRRGDPGVSTTPAPPSRGFRGSRPATLDLVDCRVPESRLVGRLGTGLSHVAADALIVGRLSVAHGASGLARAALDSAVQRAALREQFGGPLHRLQLVRGLLADAAVAVDAADLLCRQAARALDERDEWAVSHVLTAKLAASRAASTAAAAAAQIHGAAGLVEGSPVDRFVQDARAMEIIEGNTQLLQHLVADQLLNRFRARGAGVPGAPADGGRCEA